MSATHGSADGDHRAGRYDIRLRGHLEARWAAWFDGLSVSPGSDGTTVISGSVPDQAALHGLLNKVRDLGLPLVSVTRVGPAGSNAPTTESHQIPTNVRKEQER
jgi:hypothetical protein